MRQQPPRNDSVTLSHSVYVCMYTGKGGGGGHRGRWRWGWVGVGGKRGENTIKSRHEVTVVLYTCPFPPCYLSQAATSKAPALLTFTGLIR